MNGEYVALCVVGGEGAGGSIAEINYTKFLTSNLLLTIVNNLKRFMRMVLKNNEKHYYVGVLFPRSFNISFYHIVKSPSVHFIYFPQIAMNHKPHFLLTIHDTPGR